MCWFGLLCIMITVVALYPDHAKKALLWGFLTLGAAGCGDDDSDPCDCPVWQPDGCSPVSCGHSGDSAGTTSGEAANTDSATSQ